MMDIELLRSFVSVVDAGGFTKAGERVHRTQSTVSQQIKRLEDQLGRPLLQRNGKQATLTEEGERLLSYARRILALEQEARDVVARPMADGVVRLGIPEDFAAYRLTELLSDFVRARPTLRLDVSCGRSVVHKHALEVGELDIALYKRNAGDGSAIAAWPERLQWVTSRVHPVDLKRDPIPLAVMEQGCLYRNRLIHAIEAAGPHLAYRLHESESARHTGRRLCRAWREHATRRCNSARAQDHHADRLSSNHEYRAGARCRRSCQPGNTASGGSAGGVLFELRSARRRRISVGQTTLGGKRIKPAIAEQVCLEGKRTEHIGKHRIAYVEPAGECAEGRHDHAGSHPPRNSAGSPRGRDGATLATGCRCPLISAGAPVGK
jgi:DNA-binding transcriptional LysR family regulator